MKKIFSFFAALMAVVAVNATVVTLTPSQFTAVAEKAISETVDGITVAISPKGTVTAEQFRIFKSSKITISAESEISGIVFTCTANGDAKYGPGSFTAQEGYSFEGKVGTWVGTPATSVSFSADANQVRATKIEVYLDGETPDAPAPAEVIQANVAEAIAVGMALEDGKSTEAIYEVTGFVVNAQPYNAQYKNQIWWMADDAENTGAQEFEAYACTVSENKTVMQVLNGDKVTLKGNITKYNDTKNNKIVIEIKNGTAVFVSKVDGDHSIDGGVTPPPAEDADTISVARALEVGAALEAGKSSDKVYVIQGYVSSIVTKYDATNENETFWMADSKESTAASNADNAFEVYRGKIDIKEEIGLGAFVCVTAKVYKYQPKSGDPIIETSNNPIPAVHVIEKGAVVKVDTISVAQALEIGNALSTGAVSDKEYAIKGYVSDIQDYFSEQYKNETFWITDVKGARTKDKAQAFEVYRGKPNTGKEIGLDALIIITCKIKNYNGTIENDGVNLPFEVLEQGGEVKVDTVTVAQALEIGNALEDNAYTDNPYVVIGYVVKAYDPDEGKTQQNFYMADELNVKGDFYAYKANPDSKIVAGDYVELFGKIQKYVGSKGTTIELSYGTAKHLEAPKIDTINVTQALEIGAALENGGQTEKNYFVLGYVAEITEEYDGEELESFTLSDDETEVEAEFEARDARVGETAAAVHDKVLLFGKILKDENGKIHMKMAAAKINPGQGIKNIIVTEKARKIVVDGVIYIVRDNKIFTLQGTQVR